MPVKGTSRLFSAGRRTSSARRQRGLSALGRCAFFASTLCVGIALVQCGPGTGGTPGKVFSALFKGEGEHEPYASLANQGILPLSVDNSFNGANLFVAQEAERSRILLNFLNGRGGPRAIQIVDDGASYPIMYLYYPEEREVFAASLELGAQYRQWVVRGPYAIERRIFRELVKLSPGTAGEPLFHLGGRNIRFRPPVSKPPTVLTPVLPTPTPTPMPTARPKVRPTPRHAEIKPLGTPTPSGAIAPKFDPSTDPTTGKTINTDLRALITSQGFVDRDPNGDGVHVVKSEHETLEKISAWYTGSDKNVPQIATASGIPEGKELIAGQKVKIPKSLLTRFRALTSDS